MTDIIDIIKQSSFSVIEGQYVYARVDKIPTSTHFMVSQDKDEITVVTKDEMLTELSLIERNKETYSLISLNVSVPFYSVGFLATVSQAIADQGMNILIISTYSKDYILVKKGVLATATKALLTLGFHKTK